MVLNLTIAFLGSDAPDCLEAADADDDAAVNITDPIYTLNYLFLGGETIPSPFPECGTDPSPDSLGCTAGSCP